MQLPQHRPARIALALTLLAALLVLAWWLTALLRKPAPTAAVATPVSVAAVERRDVPHLSDGIGSVQSLHNVVIRAQVDGVLTEVLFREGQLVKAGDLLARIDDRSIAADLEQARAELARSQAQLAAARLDLTRYRNLVEEGAVSRQAIDQQAAQVAELEGAVQSARATIAAREVQLSYTTIRAPVSGRVGIRRVDPGNVVRSTDSDGLVTVTQIKPIAVLFSFPQEQLAAVQRALRQPPVPVVALDRYAGAVLAEGVLTTVDNAIDAGTGTIRLKASFANTDESLWPGQFVTVQLRVGLSAQALTLPGRAVQRGLDGEYVYRVRAGKAEVVPVTVTYRDDAIAVIGRGLEAGDSVVIDGQSRLRPGAEVSVIAAAKTAPAVTANGSGDER